MTIWFLSFKYITKLLKKFHFWKKQPYPRWKLGFFDRKTNRSNLFETKTLNFHLVIYTKYRVVYSGRFEQINLKYTYLFIQRNWIRGEQPTNRIPTMLWRKISKFGMAAKRSELITQLQNLRFSWRIRRGRSQGILPIVSCGWNFRLEHHLLRIFFVNSSISWTHLQVCQNELVNSRFSLKSKVRIKFDVWTYRMISICERCPKFRYNFNSAAFFGRFQ